MSDVPWNSDFAKVLNRRCMALARDEEYIVYDDPLEAIAATELRIVLLVAVKALGTRLNAMDRDLAVPLARAISDEIAVLFRSPLTSELESLGFQQAMETKYGLESD
jgi:hypothetical protein